MMSLTGGADRAIRRACGWFQRDSRQDRLFIATAISFIPSTFAAAGPGRRPRR